MKKRVEKEWVPKSENRLIGKISKPIIKKEYDWSDLGKWRIS